LSPDRGHRPDKVFLAFCPARVIMLSGKIWIEHSIRFPEIKGKQDVIQTGGYINDLAKNSAFIPRAILLMPLVAAAFFFLREDRKRALLRVKQLLRQGWTVAFLFYLSFLLMCTVYGRDLTNPYQSVFTHFGFTNDEKWNRQIIENVLIFIPLTFLYLKAFRVRRPVLSAAKLSTVTTLFIELSQLFFWLGEFQFSDLVYNFIGGMTGYGLWRLVNRTGRWMRKHIGKTNDGSGSRG